MDPAVPDTTSRRFVGLDQVRGRRTPPASRSSKCRRQAIDKTLVAWEVHDADGDRSARSDVPGSPASAVSATPGCLGLQSDSSLRAAIRRTSSRPCTRSYGSQTRQPYSQAQVATTTAVPPRALSLRSAADATARRLSTARDAPVQRDAPRSPVLVGSGASGGTRRGRRLSRPGTTNRITGVGVVPAGHPRRLGGRLRRWFSATAWQLKETRCSRSRQQLADRAGLRIGRD